MAGILEGDLLQEINGFEVKTLDDVSKSINKDDKSLITMIKRGENTFILQVTKND